MSISCGKRKTERENEFLAGYIHKFFNTDSLYIFLAQVLVMGDAMFEELFLLKKLLMNFCLDDIFPLDNNFITRLLAGNYYSLKQLFSSQGFEIWHQTSQFYQILYSVL